MFVAKTVHYSEHFPTLMRKMSALLEKERINSSIPFFSAEDCRSLKTLHTSIAMFLPLFSPFEATLEEQKKWISNFKTLLDPSLNKDTALTLCSMITSAILTNLIFLTETRSDIEGRKGEELIREFGDQFITIDPEIASMVHILKETVMSISLPTACKIIKQDIEEVLTERYSPYFDKLIASVKNPRLFSPKAATGILLVEKFFEMSKQNPESFPNVIRNLIPMTNIKSVMLFREDDCYTENFKKIIKCIPDFIPFYVTIAEQKNWIRALNNLRTRPNPA